MRNIGTAPTAQFVSGFSFPPPAPPPATGVELQITGRILSLNAGNRSFQLAGLPIAVFVDSFTKFDGASTRFFSDLDTGFDVAVTGFSRPDFTIYATHVRVTNRNAR